MIKWANECKRVLKNEGTLFLNIGDKYGKKSIWHNDHCVTLEGTRTFTLPRSDLVQFLFA